MKYVVEDTSLVAIAEAIRAKTGKSAPLTLADMPTAIASIETSGSSGSENSFPTAEAGLYKNGTNFTELLYAWDNICKDSYADAGNSATDYYLYDDGTDSAGYATFVGGVAGDLIIPETFNSRPVEEIYDLFCGNIVIPSTVTDILNLGDYTEQYNGGAATTQPCYVETIYIKATTPPAIESFRIKGLCSRLSKIVVPKGCGDTYKSETGWCDFAEIIVEADE